MNQLTKFLVDGILNEGEQKVLAAYGGGFKPPTTGHFEVVKQALKDHPEIEEFIIYVGSGERDGINQSQSILIWEIYQTYLPMKVKIEPSKSPIGDVLRLGKNNPQDKVYFVIGAREENEGDFEDIKNRTRAIGGKHPNMEVKVITTKNGGMSGTNARKAAKVSFEDFVKFLPTELSDDEKETVYNIVKPVVKESLNEGKQVGTLYHYTSKDGLKGILKSNSIKASEEYYLGGEIYYISFTRNKNFHKKGMKFNVKTDYRITLDGDKLSNRYKIQPFAYIPGWSYEDSWEYEWLEDEDEQTRRDFFNATGDYDEQEERIYFKDENGEIPNIKNYIITVDKTSELKESLNENASYSQDIDVKSKIMQLTQHMLDKGYNIEPLPNVELIDGDSVNAREFLGKTAYYDPNSATIVLYTEGRHPKDIVRSFSHEMIHHIQNLEGRLEGITTTNTQEDDHLNDIEAEANLKGTMTFRNWTDSLNENLNDGLYPFKVTDKTYDDEDDSLITVEYGFQTPNHKYRVNFYSGEYGPEEKKFDLSFGVNTGEFNKIDTFQMTGEGNARKILKTIRNIIEDFIDKEDVEKIIVDGTDEKRKRIYKAIFSKLSNKIEIKEANLKGTMTFRNWTDSLNENLTKNSNQIYHWTSYSACKKIIESNKLKSNEANQFFEYDESRILPDYKNVVFFTKEDERFADEENSNQCILVVDKSKLSEDYKVISYGDPYEETVVYTNDPSIPILPYLKGVILMNTLQKSAIKKMVEFLKSKGIPYEINDNLEKQVIAKKAMLPSLKKELINKLKLKYPNGFIGYLNTPLVGYQTPEYFKDNSTYSSPNITINKPGEYGEKNKFQIKFKIEPQNLEKYINWFMYSPDSIEDLIDMDNYEGEELWLKGNIPIDTTSLQEANLKGTMTFRNWTDSLNENILPQEKFAQEQNRDYIEQALKILPNKDKYNLKDYTVEILPIDKVKPTQFGEDYINASSEYEAEQYQKYIDGEISAEDLRREDFYPIVVDKDTMEILDGNHRHAVHTILSIPKIKAILVSKKLNKLNEIGDSSAKSYDYTLTLNSWYSVKYEFITDSDLNYVVLFDKSDDISDVVFYAQGLKSSTGSKFKATSNRGELFKIMSTVVKIVIDFLSKNSNINTLVIEPSKQDEGDDRRLNLYMQYIKNVIDPKEYDVKSNSKEIVISRKTNLEDMENVNEIIQENRIECKNCGWGWDMENGGEDPYICHKCGYDNSPLKEKKNKDQFGLNQYARELAQGLEEDEGEIRNIWRSQENTLSLPVVEPNKDMNYEIYSDMDGVLTDFDAQFMKASDGIPPSEYEKNFGTSGFWELIDGKGVGFWVGMPWMSDGKIYWDYIKKYNPILLSSPSRSQTSRLGKRLWVKNNMPGVKLILAQAKDKQNYAQKDRILIDDRPSNIDQWRASGGVGILHISASDTIRQLKELGI
jgi:hypothetical protein